MKEKCESFGRRTPTKTLLNRLRREAKALVREGLAYQNALEHLAVQAGYSNGWSGLQRAVKEIDHDVAFILPEMDRGARNAKQLDRTPIWNRTESELNCWFERPFVDRAGPHNYPMILCLDGRVWNEPSLITEWWDEENHKEVIEFAKDRFAYLLAHSKWEVEPHCTEPGVWSVVLHWTHSVPTSNVSLREPLFFGPSKEILEPPRADALCEGLQRC